MAESQTQTFTSLQGKFQLSIPDGYRALDVPQTKTGLYLFGHKIKDQRIKFNIFITLQSQKNVSLTFFCEQAHQSLKRAHTKNLTSAQLKKIGSRQFCLMYFDQSSEEKVIQAYFKNINHTFSVLSYQTPKENLNEEVKTFYSLLKNIETK
ncbi:MAG: hypothetical protein HY390_02985 [Deltaproteobacteria bacterium]|nr:hypothetical protein [Deltaproteobacteria bacterium]